MPLFIFLSHDVDWPRHGPGIDHIMARKKRFNDDIIKRVIIRISEFPS
jgi:hypothetical protein